MYFFFFFGGRIKNNLIVCLTENVNFLVADGIKFAHPLHHLGKSKEDLPLIAIDSFRHMYLFPKYEDMHIPGRLKQVNQNLFLILVIQSKPPMFYKLTSNEVVQCRTVTFLICSKLRSFVNYSICVVVHQKSSKFQITVELLG